MPISGCHDLPLATFNLPSRNNLQNKPNSAATMSLPCSRFATESPQPQGGLAFPSERRGDSFTHYEADAIRAANPGPFPDSAGEIRWSRDLDWAE